MNLLWEREGGDGKIARSRGIAFEHLADGGAEGQCADVPRAEQEVGAKRIVDKK